MPGRVFVTGDTHGGVSGDMRKLTGSRFPEKKELTKDDYLIIAGDFGFVWSNNSNDRTEQHWYDWFEKRPWTTLFLDGNHDNHPRLKRLPKRDMFGSTVGVVNESIFHLLRGRVYDINDRIIFTFGGARSYDKKYRTPNIDWWPDEEPGYMEMKLGLFTLKEVCKNKVDYIITHEAPWSIYSDLVDEPVEYQLPKYIDELLLGLDFKQHFFGHHHQDVTIDKKHICCYNKIHELK